MAPKILEWQGLEVKIYSDDHELVHVHIIYNEFESIVEFEIEKGEILGFQYRGIEGSSPLPPAQQKKVNKLIQKYKYDILQSWVDFFTLQKEVKTKRIRGKKL